MKIQKSKPKLKIVKRAKHSFTHIGSACTLEWAGASACGDGSTRFY